MNYRRLLEGKNAVITSGAHGMGMHIALVFARHGARVAVNGLRQSGIETGETLNRISPGSFFIRCDMSDPASVESFISETLSKIGRADIVVNNVGINMNDEIGNISDEKFSATQQVNIRGAVRMARAFLPGMFVLGGGAFVHISTVHSVLGFPLNSAYASSKAAVNEFSRQLARIYGPRGVRSNVICPGGIHTGKSAGTIKDLRRNRALMQEELKRNDETSFAISPGSAFDIANTALYLASDMSRGTSGETVMVDGGNVMQAYPFNAHLKPPDHAALWEEHMTNLLEQPEF